MPLSRIAVPDHLVHDKIRALADAVHHGLVETCNVPEKDLFQLVSTFPSSMMIIDPIYGDVSRTSEASIVEILFLTGRTVDQKSRLFHAIAERAMQAGFKGDDIMIALTENAPSDWSLGYGRAYGK
jgi:hypothetical protein